MQPIKVKGADGIAIAAQEWGNPRGREVLFIHGFNQSHLSWQRQVSDPGLGEQFRMVTFDLRGHGGSDKPLAKESYEDDRLWAGDVAAVIAASGLKRPVLVGWSYAGRVIADYLRVDGEGGIAGVNYVNARCSSDSALFAKVSFFGDVKSSDLATNIAGTRAFLRACFELQPEPDDFERMLAFNMVVPAPVRNHVLDRRADTTEAMARLTRPVLVTHGRLDKIVLPTMAEFVARTVKGARLSFYEGIGHSPFWEDTPRFNRELAEFVGTTA